MPREWCHLLPNLITWVQSPRPIGLNKGMRLPKAVPDTQIVVYTRICNDDKLTPYCSSAIPKNMSMYVSWVKWWAISLVFGLLLKKKKKKFLCTEQDGCDPRGLGIKSAPLEEPSPCIVWFLSQVKFSTLWHALFLLKVKWPLTVCVCMYVYTLFLHGLLKNFPF